MSLYSFMLEFVFWFYVIKLQIEETLSESKEKENLYDLSDNNNLKYFYRLLCQESSNKFMRSIKNIFKYNNVSFKYNWESFL